MAEKKDHESIQEYLDNSLWIAAAEGNIEEVKKLIEQGANVNCLSDGGGPRRAKKSSWLRIFTGNPLEL